MNFLEDGIFIVLSDNVVERVSPETKNVEVCGAVVQGGMVWPVVFVTGA